MPKNITITNIDSASLKDVNNMTRQKVKLIHEQEFENYGIDPEKVYKNSGMLKTLPPEWVPEIINENINSIKIPKNHHNFNKNEKSFVLGFESDELCANFYKEFNINLFKIANSFITKKGEKPSVYNRIIVLETTLEGQQLIIRY